MRDAPLSLRRCANVQARRRTFCGDSGPRNALAVAPCKIFKLAGECRDSAPRHALAVYGAMRNFNVANDIAEIARVEMLSLWHRVRIFNIADRPSPCFQRSVLRVLFGIDDSLAVLGAWECWRMEYLANSAWNRRTSPCSGSAERPGNVVWNRRPSPCFRRVKALAHAASLNICLQLMAVPLISAGGNAGAWCLRTILLGIVALLAVLGRRGALACGAS